MGRPAVQEQALGGGGLKFTRKSKRKYEDLDDNIKIQPKEYKLVRFLLHLLQ